MDLVSLGIAGVGGALELFGKKSAHDLAKKQAKRQYAAQRKMQDAARNFQNLQIRKGNEYRARLWEAKKGVYNQQIKFNEEAAARAYDATQINRDRQLTHFAFQMSDRQMELMEAIGANAASIEGDNRSARLAAAKMTLGRFGRTQMQDKLRITELNFDSERAMEDIYRQNLSANFQAKSRLGIAPMFQDEIPPMNYSAPAFGDFNWATASAGAFMTASSLYNTFAPKSTGPLGGGGSGGGYGVNSSNYSSQAAGYGGGFNMTNTGVDMSGSLSGNFSGNQLGLVNVNVKDAFKIGS